MIIALAIPPASHMVCSPYRPPVCSRWLSQHRVARDVARLLADLLGAADDDVLDQGGVKSGAGEEGLERSGQQVDGMHAGQRAARLALARGGADGVDDDRGPHVGYQAASKTAATPWPPPTHMVSSR
jgi:hypothetical protein